MRPPRLPPAAVTLAAVSAGGGLGSMARYLVGESLPTTAGHFPWATLVVNVTGCFAIGALLVLVLEVWPPRRYVRPFLGIGLLGGYTTFSTLAVETQALLTDGQAAWADTYPLVSLLAGLAAAALGFALTRGLADRSRQRLGARERTVHRR